MILIFVMILREKVLTKYGQKAGNLTKQSFFSWSLSEDVACSVVMEIKRTTTLS